MIALIYGSIFYQLKTGTDESCYTTRLSLLFMIVTSAFLLSAPVIIELFEGKEVYRLRDGCMYRWTYIKMDAWMYRINVWIDRLMYRMDGSKYRIDGCITLWMDV